jgi:ABC-2 type transport system permease protein
MADLGNTLWIETHKALRSRVPLFTLAGFLILPLAMAMLMVIYKDPQFARDIGLLTAKANLAGGSFDWPFFLDMFTQGVAVGGMLLFSLIESWVFGREFADGTVKDLLAVPVGRGTILAAKFLVGAVWAVALTAIIYAAALAAGALVGLPLGTPALFTATTLRVTVATLLVCLTVTPVAFFASVGRGYLLPMGLAILLVMLANLAALLGWGELFPWAIPGLYAGLSKSARLGAASYLVVILTGLAGAVGTYAWWKQADQR